MRPVQIDRNADWTEKLNDAGYNDIECALQKLTEIVLEMSPKAISDKLTKTESGKLNAVSLRTTTRAVAITVGLDARITAGFQTQITKF